MHLYVSPFHYSLKNLSMSYASAEDSFQFQDDEIRNETLQASSIGLHILFGFIHKQRLFLLIKILQHFFLSKS